MEIKKGLGLVLVMLGMTTTLQAKQMATSSDDESEVADESGRKSRAFASEFSTERFKDNYHRAQKERRDKRHKLPKKREYSEFFYPNPAQENKDTKLYFDLAIGSMKYIMPTISLVDAAGLTDTVSLDHASWIPMLRGGMGAEFVGVPCCCADDDGEHTTRARVGWQISFGKKNAAITTFYTNSGYTSPNLLGVQDVFRGELLAVASYDLIRDKFSIEAGLGVVGGALKDFALFQPLTNTTTNQLVPALYTGQYLKPYKASAAGFVGLTLAHRFKCEDRVRFEFGYRSVFNNVSYHTTIYQNQPAQYAAQQYQNGFSMSQTAGLAVLPQKPKFKVRAQQLTFAIVAEF